MEKMSDLSLDINYSEIEFQEAVTVRNDRPGLFNNRTCHFNIMTAFTF